jgi:hypothetical protein
MDVGFYALAGDRASLDNLLGYIRRSAAIGLFFVGCAIMLGALRLMLFAFQRKERGSEHQSVLRIVYSAFIIVTLIGRDLGRMIICGAHGSRHRAAIRAAARSL